MDGDDLCESGDDLFGIAYAAWNGSFEAPKYSGVVSEYFENGQGACPVVRRQDVGTPP